MIGKEQEEEDAENMEGFDEQPRIMNTFAGTPLYVSPEMLNDNLATYGSDLWALGCIIYQCLIGKPPFQGAEEVQLYKMILSLTYNMPDDVPEPAKDIIRKLLVLNPLERLGGGHSGSGNELDKLRAHPFFTGIDFSSIITQEPPIQVKKDFSPLKQVETPKSGQQAQPTQEAKPHPPAAQIVKQLTEEEQKHADHEKIENMFRPGNGEIIKSAKVMK